MLKICSTIPTKNLPIKKVLAKLTQSFIYTQLDDKEHDGYRHSSGKLFKALNFRLNYYDYALTIEFTSLKPEHEMIVAQSILTNGLKLGEVKINDTSVQWIDKTTTQNEIKVKGFVAVEDTTFKFMVASKEKIDNSFIALFKEALETHGIGAKTAVGYGYFYNLKGEN